MDQFLPLSWKLMDGDLVPLLKVAVWETNTAMAQSQPLSKSLSCARHCGKNPTALPNTLPSDLLMRKWAGSKTNDPSQVVQHRAGLEGWIICLLNFIFNPGLYSWLWL